MADRLSQLQDFYGQLATQFYASIKYISSHHPSLALAPPPPSRTEQGDQSKNTDDAAHQQSTKTDMSDQPLEQRPDSPNTFTARQEDLARDLLIQTKQIEALISVLPGVEKNQETQKARMEELDADLKMVLEEHKKAEEERQVWMTKVERIIGSVRR